MRLGLLGPAPDHREALARAARWLEHEQAVDRVIYLGADRMLDTVVSSWAEELVGPGADDLSVMARATKLCLRATPKQIDAFLNREQERNKLRLFESLPGESTRSVELIGGKVAVMLYDKADLEEDDILPATLLIFGRSRRPLAKQIGRRWFLAPGTFPHHGIMVIDDEDECLRATIYDQDFHGAEVQKLEAPKELLMSVQGEE